MHNIGQNRAIYSDKYQTLTATEPKVYDDDDDDDGTDGRTDRRTGATYCAASCMEDRITTGEVCQPNGGLVSWRGV